MDERPKKCKCGAALQARDELSNETSQMSVCSGCRHYTLTVRLCEEDGWGLRHDYSVSVFLRDFHLKRRLADDADWKRPPDDLQLASKFAQTLRADVWPSPAQCVDWGIDTQSHLGALQWLVYAGATPFVLDRVIGDGSAITALVQSMRFSPYRDVVFQTCYDDHDWSEENGSPF